MRRTEERSYILIGNDEKRKIRDGKAPLRTRVFDKTKPGAQSANNMYAAMPGSVQNSKRLHTFGYAHVDSDAQGRAWHSFVPPTEAFGGQAFTKASPTRYGLCTSVGGNGRIKLKMKYTCLEISASLKNIRQSGKKGIHAGLERKIKSKRLRGQVAVDNFQVTNKSCSGRPQPPTMHNQWLAWYKVLKVII